MKYAVAHAPMGSSVILSWDKDDDPAQMSLLSTTEEKEEFVENIGKTDTVYMCLGGAEDRLALACIIRGAEVKRISVHKLGADIEVGHIADEEPSLDAARDDINEDEGNEVDEDSKELARRKERAAKVYSAALARPDSFYDTKPSDIDVLVLVVLYKGFRLMQRSRIATHLRLLSVYRDLYLVDAARRKTTQTEEEYLLDRLSKEKSFGDLPPEARVKYLEGVKAGDEIYEAVTEREKTLLADLKKQLNKLLLFTEVFEPIKGCGPLISARMIGAISDIRRFPDDAKLKAYAGYHHFADGSRAHRIKGQPFSCSPTLKQGVWQFTQQVVKTPAGESEWRNLLDRRRAYELIKLLSAIGNDYLPISIKTKMPIESVKQLTVEDLDILLAFIDGLRGETEAQVKDEKGKMVKVPYETYLNAKFASRTELLARVLASYNEGLTKFDNQSIKLVKGIKVKALNKACRWLGQRFLRYVHQRWTDWQKKQDVVELQKAA